MQAASAQTVQADVISIEAVTDYVNVVKLKPQVDITFLAGQYLQIVLANDDKRIFSIASSPHDSVIELHIGAGPDDSYPRGALDHLANHDTVTLEVGLGEAYFRDQGDRPIILMAGGTGFSYTRSIARHIKHRFPNRPVTFYWGARDEKSLYANDEMNSWATSADQFEFVPVVETPSDSWTGKTGYVHQAVMSDISDLSSYDIYLAGPFKMAGIARDDFVKQGAKLDNMFADAFAYI
jgi:NAD(P)H-flavin reductase